MEDAANADERPSALLSLRGAKAQAVHCVAPNFGFAYHASPRLRGRALGAGTLLRVGLRSWRMEF